MRTLRFLGVFDAAAASALSSVVVSGPRATLAAARSSSTARAAEMSSTLCTPRSCSRALVTCSCQTTGMWEQQGSMHNARRGTNVIVVATHKCTTRVPCGAVGERQHRQRLQQNTSAKHKHTAHTVHRGCASYNSRAQASATRQGVANTAPRAVALGGFVSYLLGGPELFCWKGPLGGMAHIDVLTSLG